MTDFLMILSLIVILLSIFQMIWRPWKALGIMTNFFWISLISFILSGWIVTVLFNFIKMAIGGKFR